MSKRSCFILYLLLMGDFVTGKEDHILTRKMNESYSHGYGTMLFTENVGEYYRNDFSARISVSTHFTTPKQDNNKSPVMMYKSFGFEEFSTAKSLPSLENNPAIDQLDEQFNAFVYFKICLFIIILIVGLLANSFSFLIIVKQGLIKSGVWVYLAALSISDSLAIIMTKYK